MVRKYYGCVQRIVDELKETFGYIIPIENDNDSEGIVMSYLFSESNSEKMNQLICHLLDMDDEEITDCVWKYCPTNAKNYAFNEKLAAFAEKRRVVFEDRLKCRGNIYNRTQDIPFDKGVITPLNDSHRQPLSNAIQEEAKKIKNLRDKLELEAFLGGIESGNRQQGKEPSFAIISDQDGLVGHIKLTKGGYFSLRSSGEKTYNLEYYIMPQHRHKGYAKTALKAFMGALQNHQIIVYQMDPLFCYGVEEVVLPIKMTNALILTDNIPSIKTIESIGEFEKLGTIKWVDDDNVEEAFCYTRIFD